MTWRYAICKTVHYSDHTGYTVSYGVCEYYPEIEGHTESLKPYGDTPEELLSELEAMVADVRDAINRGLILTDE